MNKGNVVHTYSWILFNHKEWHRYTPDFSIEQNSAVEPFRGHDGSILVGSWAKDLGIMWNILGVRMVLGKDICGSLRHQGVDSAV
jgi:hypothetical protein